MLPEDMLAECNAPVEVTVPLSLMDIQWLTTHASNVFAKKSGAVKKDVELDLGTIQKGWVPALAALTTLHFVLCELPQDLTLPV